MDLQYGYSLIGSVLDCFRVETPHLLEWFPPKEGDRDSCFLWSYFAVTGMLYRAVKAGLPLREEYKAYIDGFGYYRRGMGTDGPVKYHSERGAAPGEGRGPCFFDDNIWTARNLLQAYEVFGMEEHLLEAQRIVEFVHSGWNEELGGVVWNENGLTEDATVQELERGLSANACAALVDTVLYSLTGKEEHLTWALRSYDFCKRMQDPVTKIYYNGLHTVLEDGKRYNGSVNKDLYSYNTGSMVLVDLELYKITGDPAYLDDARSASDAAFEAFGRTDPKSGEWYMKDFIWFTAVMAEGWQALCPFGGPAREYLRALGRTVEESAGFARPEGLLPHDLVCGWREDDDYDRMLLTHSAIAEIAVLCAGI